MNETPSRRANAALEQQLTDQLVPLIDLKFLNELARR